MVLFVEEMFSCEFDRIADEKHSWKTKQTYAQKFNALMHSNDG